jgi:hypothetical protein
MKNGEFQRFSLEKWDETMKHRNFKHDKWGFDQTK